MPETIVPMSATAQLIGNGAANEVAVKVACRVRPLSSREKMHQHQPCVRIATEKNQIVIGKDKQFTFDYVIPPKVNQSDLYDQCVKGLVNGLFDGYNATVFAYGQTGAGKTYTISGNKTASDEYGIIPRAVHSMFQIINKSTSPINSNRSNSQLNQHVNNKEYVVKVNFIEIYKEECKDLLDNVEKDLQIREDESGNTLIYGANEVVCTSLQEVMSCFDAGSGQRHVGSTLMNEESSRSHSVFTVSIEQRWTDAKAANVQDSSHFYDMNKNEPNSYFLGAKFHFVDLAGSERVNRTGNVGDRFKESVHINSGLLALGNVISALSSTEKTKNKHIPYRESKITRILKDSLGGNANTLMICCISPSSCNLDESINALKYASRARYIKNKPIVNMDSQTQCFVEMQSEIQALREELQRQRTASAVAGNYDNQNMSQNSSSECEAKLEAVKNENVWYKKMVHEAMIRFKMIKDGEVKPGIIDEWLAMLEESSSNFEFTADEFGREKIRQLEQQLQQALDDLKSDEEIFADREKEINSMREDLNDLENKLNMANRYLEAAYSKEKEQQELLLQLQIKLDNLTNQQQKETSNELFIKSPLDLNENIRTGKNSRAKTAPNGVQELLTASQKNDQKNEKTVAKRTVNSSPALFTLEKVMQSFRARSQILAETLEESDNVITKRNFGSTFDVSKDVLGEVDENIELIDGGSEEEKLGNFIRKGTFKVKKNDSVIGADLKVSGRNKENGVSKETVKKLRDLSINVKMKEELIKELVANSKFTNRINQQYEHTIESLKKEALRHQQEIEDLSNRLAQTNLASTVKDPPTKTETELKKQVDIYKSKVSELEAKQKDTTKHLNTTLNSDKRIADLEVSLSKLRQQNELLQKKIREECDKKIKVEKDLDKEQQRLKDLELRSEQQTKLLKKKTEDLLAVQRRIRSNSSNGLNNMNGLNGNCTNSDENMAGRNLLEMELERLWQDKFDLSNQNDVKKLVGRMGDFREREQSLVDELNELQQQLNDQNRLVEKLKKMTNVGGESQRMSVRSERGMISDRVTDEQNEYNLKMSNMEKEILHYKEKLSKLAVKGGGKKMDLERSGNGISQAPGQSTGSFHIVQSNANFASDSILSMTANRPVNGNESVDGFNSSSMQKIKVSRKDLKKLNEEEVLKRSSTKTGHF